MSFVRRALCGCGRERGVPDHGLRVSLDVTGTVASASRGPSIGLKADAVLAVAVFIPPTVSLTYGGSAMTLDDTLSRSLPGRKPWRKARQCEATRSCHFITSQLMGPPQRAQTYTQCVRGQTKCSSPVAGRKGDGF